MAKQIKIFDTTLRDGEQSPGCSMNLQEKIEIAKQLEKLGVDVMETGFAIASPGDFASVKKIAETVNNCTVACLARALEKDIDRAWEAVKNAQHPLIHTFIATSDLHLQHKLKMTPDAVIEQIDRMVRRAKKYCSASEFSAEDASRTRPEFLYRAFETAIKAGATVINIPDTVGYTIPEEFYGLVQGVINNVAGIEKVDVSVHCHNDLGLAVANSLSAMRAGATQLECTINGIGERAGNASLEELVMAINTRRDFYGVNTRVDTRQIYNTSRLLTSITGVPVQPNKAIVGANAFAHEAGIHQHGVLADKRTYEIMTPESVGLPQNRMVLGKHSGKHAFVARLSQMGYVLDEAHIEQVFNQFKELADKKKLVSDLDIRALVESGKFEIPEVYRLKRFVINSGNTITSTAILRVMKENRTLEEVATGDGPVDAAFNAIEKSVGMSFKLEDYTVHAVTEGKDAQGEAVIVLLRDDKLYRGRGLSTDVVEASIKAYLDAINHMLYETNVLKGE